MIIQQLSDADAFVLEITKFNLKIILLCMYLDRKNPIEHDGDGIFPKTWKRAKIIPIVKPGKNIAMTYRNTSQSAS